MFLVAFDQLVDPEAIAKVVKCWTEGLLGMKKNFGNAEALSQKEIQNMDPLINKFLATDVKEGYWAGFKFPKQFPYQTRVSVQIGPAV